MLDPSLDYDTDEEREGKFDSKLASVSKSKRVQQFQNTLLAGGKSRGITRGKWLIPVKDRDILLHHFARLVKFYAENEYKEDVRAVWYAQNEQGYLEMWNADIDDKASVWRMVAPLWGLGIYDNAYYKPEVFSVLGLRARNIWGVKVTLWKSSDRAAHVSV